MGAKHATYISTCYSRQRGAWQYTATSAILRDGRFEDQVATYHGSGFPSCEAAEEAARAAIAATQSTPAQETKGGEA